MLRVNSKAVQPGDTFLALKGPRTDGHDYIDEAIDKGAACIIATHGEYPVKTIIVEDTRTYLAGYLKELNMARLEKIKIIGVVGTGGKTLTSDIIYQLLNSLGVKTAFIGTNGFYCESKHKKLKEATPDIYILYDLINEAIDKECEVIVIEASSKAILQRHLEGLRFDACIFTNIIMDNIKNKELYLNSKLDLFKKIKGSGYAVINKNDSNAGVFALTQNKNIFYGTKDANYNVSRIKLFYDHTEFKINNFDIYSPLIGSYNVYNYLAAFALINTLGFLEEDIIEATKHLVAPDGRYQNIMYNNRLIIIDYAYNPDTIKSIIKETKKFSEGRIITIVGCGGDRSKAKRPLIGKIVTDNCDYVIFTTDNPRNEKEEDILNDITENLTKDNFETIISRKEAIKKGINMLEEKDILLILGKGHEDVQIIGNDEFPLKDYDEVIKDIKK